MNGALCVYTRVSCATTRSRVHTQSTKILSEIQSTTNLQYQKKLPRRLKLYERNPTKILRNRIYKNSIRKKKFYNIKKTTETLKILRKITYKNSTEQNSTKILSAKSTKILPKKKKKSGPFGDERHSNRVSFQDSLIPILSSDLFPRPHIPDVTHRLRANRILLCKTSTERITLR